MLWQVSGEMIELANVGVKQEEIILEGRAEGAFTSSY